MFEFEFMRIAFVVGLLLAIIIPLMGTHLVFKRLSMTGDTLSHVSLAGVAIGLLAGFSPIISAMLASVVAGLVVELIRKKFSKYSELSLAIMLSFGVGLAGLLSSYTPMANFDAYLFGSIITVGQTELWITVGLFVVVIAYYLAFYKEIMYVSYSENNAKIAGVPVGFINVSFTVLSALTVALATKIIGALLVSSLIVIPVAASLQVSKSYKSTVLWAIGFSAFSVVCGLVLSFYLQLKPGGAIVLFALAILGICMAIKPIKNKLKNKTIKTN
jgi:zinc transport system permease protein